MLKQKRMSGKEPSETGWHDCRMTLSGWLPPLLGLGLVVLVVGYTIFSGIAALSQTGLAGMDQPPPVAEMESVIVPYQVKPAPFLKAGRTFDLGSVSPDGNVDQAYDSYGVPLSPLPDSWQKTATSRFRFFDRSIVVFGRLYLGSGAKRYAAVYLEVDLIVE